MRSERGGAEGGKGDKRPASFFRNGGGGGRPKHGADIAEHRHAEHKVDEENIKLLRMPFSKGDHGGDQIDEQGGESKDSGQDVGPDFQNAHLRALVWMRERKNIAAQKKFFRSDNILQNTRNFELKKENAEIPAKSKKAFKMPCVQNYSKPQYIVSVK